MSCVKLAEPIFEILFELWTQVGPRKHVLAVHARRHSAVSCAKMVEPIEMPFGLWHRVGRSKHGVTLAPPGEYR